MKRTQEELRTEWEDLIGQYKNVASKKTAVNDMLDEIGFKCFNDLRKVFSMFSFRDDLHKYETYEEMLKLYPYSTPSGIDKLDLSEFHLHLLTELTSLGEKGCWLVKDTPQWRRDTLERNRLSVEGNIKRSRKREEDRIAREQKKTPE